MAEIPTDVALALVAGKAKTRGHFTSTGSSAFSYALELVRREIDADGNVRIKWMTDPESGSVTTARHKSALRGIIRYGVTIAPDGTMTFDAPPFYHRNREGVTFYARDLDQSVIRGLYTYSHYKAMLRKAYGPLRGIEVGQIARDGTLYPVKD